jgi:hypothetical protein
MNFLRIGVMTENWGRNSRLLPSLRGLSIAAAGSRDDSRLFLAPRGTLFQRFAATGKAPRRFQVLRFVGTGVG